MAGFEFHGEPDDARRLSAGLAAAQTYVVGDAVYLNAGQLTESPDEAEVGVAELIGYACEDATGTTAGSRATNTADGFGAATNDTRTYMPCYPGLLMRTRNYWLDPAASPPTRTAITGALRGTQKAIIHATDASIGDEGWGLDTTAATSGTDAVGIITDVLNAEMEPVYGATAGTWLVFTTSDTQIDGLT